MKNHLRSATLGMVALGLAACQSLDVPNNNNPALDEAKLNGATLETQAGTAFRYMYSVMQGGDVRNGTSFNNFALACMGNEMTIGTSNLGRNQDVCLEPRKEMNNFDQGQWINRTPYQMLYGGIATANDVLEGINVNHVQIGVPTSAAPKGLHTDRAVWWSTFMIGIGHMYLGTLFDQAIIVPPNKPYNAATASASDFKPYREVADSGVSFIRQAIALAKAAPDDSTAASWINGATNQMTRDKSVRVMYGFLARALVWPARNTTERAAVDWAAVIRAVDSSLTSTDVFRQLAVSSNIGTISYYKQLVQLQTDSRPAIRLYGPGDVSGAYQAWLATPVDQRTAITVTSPDKRISNTDLSTNGAVASAGAYVQLNSTQTMASTLGTWNWSNYRGVKFGVGTTNNYWQAGDLDIMTYRELQLLKAEGLIRIGGAANVAAAVTIINASRTANPCNAAGCATGGNLPAVTATGVPVSATCVPRKDDGSCGDLMDALMWESNLEDFGVEPTIAWVNARGWGKLVSGTAFHLPVPGRELQTYNMAYYTFGGPNNPGSAP